MNTSQGTIDVSFILAELGKTFGQKFVDSILADLGDVVLSEAVSEAVAGMPHAPLVKKSDKKKDEKRPTALKKAMAAFDRGFDRYEKKRGVEAARKMRADVDSEVAKHKKGDPNEVEKLLKSLRAKKSGMDSKSKGKAEPKKDEPKQAGGGGGGGGGGGAAGGFAKAAGSGGGRADQKKQRAALGSGGKSQHHPFSNSSNLGKGPGTPPVSVKNPRGPRKHNKKKCWNCDCGPIYTKGCVCTGTGATKDCPQGQKKNVKIRRDYRDAYNKMYHAWRASKGGEVTARIKAGGGK